MSKAEFEITLKDDGKRLPESIPAPGGGLDPANELQNAFADIAGELSGNVLDSFEAIAESMKEAADAQREAARIHIGRIVGREREESFGEKFAGGVLDSFKRGQTLTNSVFAGLAGAAGPAGAALVTVTGAAKAVVGAFEQITDALQTEADKLARYSPEIAIAQSQAEFARMRQDIARAERMGDDYAQFIENKSDIDLRIAEIMENVYAFLLQLYNELAPFAADALRSLSMLFDMARFFMDIQSDIRKYLTGAKEARDAAGGGIAMLWEEMKKARKAAENIDEKMTPENDIEDPFMQELMREARDKRTFGPEKPWLGGDMGV